MNESSRIVKWLAYTLKNDATLTALVAGRVYFGRPKSGTLFPYIKFQQQASVDVQGNGIHRMMTRPLWLVCGVVQGDMSTDSVAIADRIEALLQPVSSLTYEDVIFSIRRTQEFMLFENGPDPQQRFFNNGGIYRIDTQQAD